ncbi:MAG: A24 family peptidase [Pirellulales bacterium]
MTLPGENATAWMASPLMLLVVVPLAAGAGWLLTRGVAAIVEFLPADARRHRTVWGMTILAAVALWWWEVFLGRQLPVGIATTYSATLCLRYLAHAILFLFLAAAAWVDLRHRVIPDAITVPGVLAGLGWNAVFPDTLLPIARLLARSFATPTVGLDVLGPAGGLAEPGLPAWLASAPTVGGLAAAGLMFGVWWWAGTAPDDAPPEANTQARRLPGPRLLIALAGAGGIVAVWLVGGGHWAGLVTGLVGLTVAGGLIWATRLGASWALGREAMGFGDVTLMAMAGAWLGWQACLLACLLAVFLGLVHGLGQLLRHAESELPFGPSLCLGLVIVVVAWQRLWDAASPQFERPLELALVAGLVIGLTAITLWAWARLRTSTAAGRD